MANKQRPDMEIYSIGFTKKTAEQFFVILKKQKICRLVDVRLNNVSQLAGFTKREDLKYFVREICNAEYVHETLLAPTQERERRMGRVRKKVPCPHGAENRKKLDPS